MSDDLHLTTTDDPADPSYASYVEDHPGGVLYQSPKWLRLIDRLVPGRLLLTVASDDRGTRGVLPAKVNAPSGGGTVINSLPYFGSYGGVLADEERVRRRLLAAFARRATDEDVRTATLVENPFEPDSCDPFPSEFRTERIVQVTELSDEDADEDRLMARFAGSGRRNVRKAREEGVRVAVRNDRLDAVAEIHRANMEAKGGTPKSPAFFEAVRTELAPEEDFRVYVAERDERLLAALLVFYHRSTAEYYVPATRLEARSLQPMPLIILHALRDAAAAGISRWNWGGTWPSQTGVYRFKRKWASRERRYRYHTLVNDPSVLDARPEDLLERHPGYFVIPFDALD